MRVIKLVLEYDGSGFAGWQAQPEQRTVQGELEAALGRLTGETVRVIASGRTDAGVHARGQVVSFQSSSRLEAGVFERGLNALLPRDVAVLSAREMGPEFHARRAARGKTYTYQVLDRPGRPALLGPRAWHVPGRLDVAAMRRAAALLIGTHDFESFRSASCEMGSAVRDLRRIEIYRNQQGALVIEMRASAFLKQMARAIVGTLVEVGLHKREAGDLSAVLAARDRKRAGATAPARGLCLVRVEYEDMMEEEK